MEFRTNDKLRHAGKPEWGVGLVLDAQKALHEGRPCQRLTIRFDNAGKKTLSTAFAELVPFEGPKPIPGPAAPVPPVRGRDPARAPAPPPLPDSDPEEPSITPAQARALLTALPDKATDPFRPLEGRLRETLALYKFDPKNRTLLDWASLQSGLQDPLSMFSRHDLEVHFEAFRVHLDRHLKDLLLDARKAGLDTAPLVQQAPPLAHLALRRINHSR